MASAQVESIPQWRPTKARVMSHRDVTALGVMLAALLAALCAAWFATGAAVDDPELSAAVMQAD